MTAPRQVRIITAPTNPAELLPDVALALRGDGPAIAVRPPGVALATATRLPHTVQVGGEPTDPVATVIATSGSTGTPRLVALPASALLASATATHDRLGGPGHWLLTLPVHHVAGWQILVRTIAAESTLEALPSRAPFTAEAFIAAARRLPSGGSDRRYTALVPTQLRRLLNPTHESVATHAAAVAALAGFDAVLIGGAALPSSLRQQAREAGITICSTYGSTETSGGCVYDGLPLPGVRIDLAEHDGRITIRGPMLAAGYLTPDGDLLSDPAFGSDMHGRFLRTDDLGSWVRDPITRERFLTIVGRSDDAIISGGLTLQPHAIEDAIGALPEIAEVAVVGVPDEQWGERVVAAIVLKPGAVAPDPQSVRRHVDSILEPGAGPRELHVLTMLPLRGPGKIDRAQLRGLLTTAPPDVTVPASHE